MELRLGSPFEGMDASGDLFFLQTVYSILFTADKRCKPLAYMLLFLLILFLFLVLSHHMMRIGCFGGHDKEAR